MLKLRGAPAFSGFRLEKLDKRLTERLGKSVSVYAEFIHLTELSEEL